MQVVCLYKRDEPEQVVCFISRECQVCLCKRRAPVDIYVNGKRLEVYVVCASELPQIRVYSGLSYYIFTPVSTYACMLTPLN